MLGAYASGTKREVSQKQSAIILLAGPLPGIIAGILLLTLAKSRITGMGYEEYLMEATILKWHKQPGDHVKMDETVLEIATDKVDTEVPSTAEGTIEQILYGVNDVVPVGNVIAKIKTEVEDTASGKGQAGSHKPADEEQKAHYVMEDSFEEREQTARISATTASFKPQTSNNNGRFYSPLVLNIAASEGVSMISMPCFLKFLSSSFDISSSSTGTILGKNSTIVTFVPRQL